MLMLKQGLVGEQGVLERVIGFELAVIVITFQGLEDCVISRFDESVVGGRVE